MAAAAKATGPAPATQSDEDAARAKRVNQYVLKAEIDRNRHIVRMEDVYKFCMPWRHKSNQSEPQDQLDEVFDSEPMTVLEDFSADMLNTFTPQKAEWVTPRPVKAFTDAG